MQEKTFTIYMFFLKKKIPRKESFCPIIQLAKRVAFDVGVLSIHFLIFLSNWLLRNEDGC